jgi:DNA-binding XRE family transcriptional regulator
MKSMKNPLAVLRGKDSQEKAAERVGVERTTWAGWEQCYRCPSMFHFVTVSRVYKLSSRQLGRLVLDYHKEWLRANEGKTVWE